MNVGARLVSLALLIVETVMLRRRVEAGAETLMALPAEAFAPAG